MVKDKGMQFFMNNMKMKRKNDKKITFLDGDLNPGFLNKFPPKIWILREIRSIELAVLRISQLYLKLFIFTQKRHFPSTLEESKKWVLTILKKKMQNMFLHKIKTIWLSASF